MYVDSVNLLVVVHVGRASLSSVIAMLFEVFEGIDDVIHLGARASFEAYPRLYPSIVKGSVNLMKAAIDMGVRSFVMAEA